MAKFPLQDQPLVLPSGRIVRIYNLLFLTQENDPSSVLRIEPNFRIQFGTATLVDQTAERLAEAEEVIAYFLGGASAEHTAEHTMVGYAEICGTSAQSERQDPPEASFKFVRDDHGIWQLVAENRVHDPSPN